MGYEISLNEKQVQAITSPIDKAVVVLSGPGTGKTIIITKRFEHIKKQGFSLEKAFILSFTRNSIEKMKKQVSSLGINVPSQNITTFASFFINILRRWGETVKIITIEDRHYWSERVIAAKWTIEEKQQSQNITGFRLANNFEKYRTKYKENTELFFSELRKDHPIHSCKELFLKTYQQYKQFLEINGGLLFEEMEQKLLNLLESEEQIETAEQAAIDFLLIDEFQDITKTKLEIIRKLMGEKKNLFCVGDLNQSIYEFAEAKPREFLDYALSFPGATKLHLSESYRCSKNIFKVANLVINKNNIQDINDTVYTVQPNGQTVSVKSFKKVDQEANWIVSKIKRLIERNKGKLTFNDFAIIYRSRRYSEDVKDLLDRERINYTVLEESHTNKNFWTKKEKISVSTIHNAKGLEWKIVFFMGFHSMNVEKEEENRNAYVGITRAQEKLYITYLDKKNKYSVIEEFKTLGSEVVREQ